eukprot:1325448-Pleurochrysis_carterae.AAC.1
MVGFPSLIAISRARCVACTADIGLPMNEFQTRQDRGVAQDVESLGVIQDVLNLETVAVEWTLAYSTARPARRHPPILLARLADTGSFMACANSTKRT